MSRFFNDSLGTGDGDAPLWARLFAVPQPATEPDAADVAEEGPDCPFCGHETRIRRDGSLTCDGCEVEWADAADVERSRQAVRAWPMEDER